jgi:two-component system phosphate regulon response regulator OmpR
MSLRLLLVDDDVRLTAMLSTYLHDRGYAVEVRHSGGGGLGAAASGLFDLVLLDIMLPDIDGLEVLRRLRATSDVPVIMLTARGEDLDRIVGLELGADDYLGKPFNPRELVARVAAVARRRSGATARGPLRFGPIEIDRDARVLRVDGEERPLTAHQFDLLRALAERAGKVLSRDDLTRAVRGERADAFDRSIDVHVAKIRAAIGDDARSPRRIHTVRGQGYRFSPSDEP